MTDRNPSVSSRPTGWLASFFGTRVPRAVFTLLGVLVGLGVAVYALGYVIRPWAHSLTGRALLIGYWQGELVYQPGDRRSLALHLREYWGEDWGWTPFNITGTAKACASRDNVRYSVAGTVRDRRGARFMLSFSPDSTAVGLHPGKIEGTWDGGDGLSLHTHFYLKGKNTARGETSVSAGGEASGSVRFELRRSSREAFEAACSSPGRQ